MCVCARAPVYVCVSVLRSESGDYEQATRKEIGRIKTQRLGMGEIVHHPARGIPQNCLEQTVQEAGGGAVMRLSTRLPAARIACAHCRYLRGGGSRGGGEGDI